MAAAATAAAEPASAGEEIVQGFASTLPEKKLKKKNKDKLDMEAKTGLEFCCRHLLDEMRAGQLADSAQDIGQAVQETMNWLEANPFAGKADFVAKRDELGGMVASPQMPEFPRRWASASAESPPQQLPNGLAETLVGVNAARMADAGSGDDVEDAPLDDSEDIDTDELEQLVEKKKREVDRLEKWLTTEAGQATLSFEVYTKQAQAADGMPVQAA